MHHCCAGRKHTPTSHCCCCLLRYTLLLLLAIGRAHARQVHGCQELRCSGHAALLQLRPHLHTHHPAQAAAQNKDGSVLIWMASAGQPKQLPAAHVLWAFGPLAALATPAQTACSTGSTQKLLIIGLQLSAHGCQELRSCKHAAFLRL